MGGANCMWNTIIMHMNAQRYLALGRYRITVLGQLDRWSQLHETKAIKMQWMQFFIWKLHIFNTHMKRQLHLALGRRRIYLFRQTGFWIQHLKKSKLWTHEVVQPYIKQTEHNKTKSNKAHTGQKSTRGHKRD